MEFIQKNLRAIIIALLAIGVVVLVANAGSNDDEAQNSQDSAVVESDEAAEDEAATEEAATPEGEEQSTEAPEGVTVGEADYTVTAVEGDNQTKLVREVIDQYVADTEGTELTSEERLYVETNLVGALPRSDVIFVGDTVRLEKETVKSTIDSAKNLNDAQRTAWAAYL